MSIIHPFRCSFQFFGSCTIFNISKLRLTHLSQNPVIKSSWCGTHLSIYETSISSFSVVNRSLLRKINRKAIMDSKLSIIGKVTCVTYVFTYWDKIIQVIYTIFLHHNFKMKQNPTCREGEFYYIQVLCIEKSLIPHWKSILNRSFY